MSEDLGLNLKISADTKQLEKEIKSLSKKLTLDLNLDITKATETLNKFTDKVEKGISKLKVDLDLKQANASLKEFKTTLASLDTLSVNLDLSEAYKELNKFGDKVEGKSASIDVDIESAEYALDLIRKSVNTLENKTTVTKFDIDTDAAEYALGILKDNIAVFNNKEVLAKLDIDPDAAKYALDVLEINVNKLEKKVSGLQVNVDTNAANFALDILEESFKALEQKANTQLDLDISKAESVFDAFTNKVNNTKFNSSLDLDLTIATEKFKGFKSQVDNAEIKSNLDLNTSKADDKFKTFVTGITNKDVVSKFSIDSDSAKKTLKVVKDKSKFQKNATELDLNITKAVNTLNKFKALSEKNSVVLPVDLNTSKADDKFDKFVKQVERLKILGKLHLDTKFATESVSDLRQYIRATPNTSKLNLDITKAQKELESFKDKLENRFINLPLKISQSSLNRLVKDLKLDLELDLSKAKETLKALKAKIEKLVFKSKFDLDTKPANDKIKALRQALKASPIEIDANLDKANDTLREFQARVARTTVYAGVNVAQPNNVTPAHPTTTPVRSTTTPVSNNAPVTSARPVVTPTHVQDQVIRVVADTSQVEPELNALQRLMSDQVKKAKSVADRLLNSVDPETYKEQVKAAKSMVLQYENQAKAAEKFSNAVKTAQSTLSAKSANLDVAKARVNLLDQELQKTRQLAAEGSRTDADVQVKEAALNKARERVALLDQEVNRTQQLASSQTVATQRLQQSNQALSTAREHLTRISAESNQAQNANDKLLATFARFSVIDNIIDRAIDVILELPGAVLQATTEIDRLRTQLEFSVPGQGQEKLEELFKTSQRLGVSFKDMSSGYASFASAVKDTELESKTDQIFESVASASAALRLSGDQTKSVFTALSQMASKGIVSMEEWRQQLSEHLKTANSVGVQALQNLVDKGTVAVTSINKNLRSVNQETRDAYKVTMQDFTNYISSGMARSADLLPEFANVLKEVAKPTQLEGLTQSIERAKNALLMLGAAIGNTFAPILVIILDKFVEIVDFVLANSDAVVGMFKPFLAIGDAIVTALTGIDVALKAMFGRGFIEIILASLDELAVALLVVFGAPLLSLIGSAVAAAAPFVATLIGAILYVQLLKAAIGAVIDVINNLTGGAITKSIEWLGKKFQSLKDYIGEVNRELKDSRTYIENLSNGLSNVGSGLGAALPTASLSKYNDILLNIQQALSEIDTSELEGIANIEQRLAENLINDATATQERLALSIETNQARLELAVQAYDNAIAGLEAGVTGKPAEELINERDKALKDISELKSELAKDSVKARKAAIDAEVEAMRLGSDKLQRETTRAELKRIEEIRKLNEKGLVNVGKAENERIALTESRINAELKLEEDKINRLNKIASRLVEGSSEESDVLNQIVEAEKRRSDLIAERANLELERLEIQQRKVESQIVGLETDKQELEIKAELLAIANELTVAQNDLVIAQNEFATARLSLEQTYAQLELDRINTALEASELLLSLDQERRDMVAERLGIESNTNEIEILRERVAQEEQISQIKYDQLLLQQQSEKQQLEFQRTQIKFEAEQEKYRLKAAKIEAQISKMKAEQAVSSAIAARNEALATGYTKAAAEAELEILQARQQSNFADDQLNLINQQNRALDQQTQIQNKILDTQEQTLEVTHEQQRTELELEQIANARSRALEIETKLIEEQTQVREQSRREALLALGYGTEAQKQAVNLQLELNQLQDTYARQAEYVADLEATGVLNSEEELILTEAQNDLNETRLSLLEVENQLIESQKIAREQNLKDALLALEYGTDAQKQASETINLQLELNRLQDAYAQQTQYIANLEASSLPYAEKNVLLSESKNELGEIRLNLLETEYRLEESLANEVAQEREKALQRQNEILENRKTLLEAELGLSQAQADLEQAKLDRRLIEIDRKEGLGKLDSEEAAEARFKIEREKLQIEAEMLAEQQKADLKRLEIEQQIEVMRLRASQAEAEVVKARAEASLAESQGALSRAIESGDEGAINAAEAAIEASQKGIEAATTQVDLIGEQIEQTLELQQLQLETIETQQKADIERLKNRERELEIAREIAQYEAEQAAFRELEAAARNSGFRVSGGGVSAGKSYIVGEQGTELFQGADGSTKLLGVNGQHAFTPNVPGKIISNQALEQVIAANVMRSDSAVVEAIQRGFKTSGTEFARLAGILANRITKPAVITNNYGSSTPSFDVNKAKLSRI